MSAPINPKPFVQELVGKRVVVKLKGYTGGMEYQGTLKATDGYMNLHLLESEEWVDGQFRDKLGEVLIRCNNVLYLRGAGNDDDEMDD